MAPRRGCVVTAVQPVTGFAMGLGIVVGITLLGVADIAFLNQIPVKVVSRFFYIALLIPGGILVFASIR